MSLIQDALKRQIEEQAGQTYAPPPPLPTKGGGGLGKFFAMLLALVLLAGAAGALFYLAAKNWSWKDAIGKAQSDLSKVGQKVSELGEGHEAQSEAESKAEPVKSASPYSSVQTRVEKMKTAVEEYVQDSAGSLEREPATSTPDPAPAPDPVAQAAPAPEAVPVAPETQGVSAVEQPPAEAAPAPVKVDDGKSWPSVTVNGIMSAGKANGAAILNGRMVGADEMVQGVRVVEVQSKGVVLEYRGESRFVMIGQTTE